MNNDSHSSPKLSLSEFSASELINTSVRIEMEKQTRSILDEIIAMDIEHDKKHVISSRADNIIESAIRLVELIENAYPEDDATNLVRKMLNSIKAKDARKFHRSFKRVNESK